MSRNSKRRRGAKRKVERRAELARSEEHSHGLNRVFRQACSGCGGSIRWVGAREAAEHGMDMETAARFVGAGLADLEFWIFASCGEAGALGPASLDL